MIEAFLLFLLLSLGMEKQAAEKQESIKVVNLEARELSEEAPEPSSPEREPQAEQRPEPQQPPREEKLPSAPAEPLPPQPAEPPALPTARPITTTAEERPRLPDIPRNTIPPAPSSRPVYGPPDTGAPAAYRDTERVGTAPNGEPLYAAAWYRKPRADQLRGYLSTASGPGWGLIACRTVPDYRVEDCVALDEYPTGSQINRAVLAAAWEFKVRPPRLGGRELVGTWVRIRIDYGIERR